MTWGRTWGVTARYHLWAVRPAILRLSLVEDKGFLLLLYFLCSDFVFSLFRPFCLCRPFLLLTLWSAFTSRPSMRIHDASPGVHFAMHSTTPTKDSRSNGVYPLKVWLDYVDRTAWKQHRLWVTKQLKLRSNKHVHLWFDGFTKSAQHHEGHHAHWFQPIPQQSHLWLSPIESRIHTFVKLGPYVCNKPVKLPKQNMSQRTGTFLESTFLQRRKVLACGIVHRHREGLEMLCIFPSQERYLWPFVPLFAAQVPFIALPPQRFPFVAAASARPDKWETDLTNEDQNKIFIRKASFIRCSRKTTVWASCSG